MKFLLTQIILFLSSVGILLYLISQEYFVPIVNKSVDWYNVSAVLILVFLILESFVSLAVFLTQKFMAYGRNEFPKGTIALKWGIGSGLALVISLLCSFYSIIPFVYGFPALLILLLIINIFTN